MENNMVKVGKDASCFLTCITTKQCDVPFILHRSFQEEILHQIINQTPKALPAVSEEWGKGGVGGWGYLERISPFQ